MQTTTEKSLERSPIDLAHCRVPIRVAVVDQHGFPRIVSLWFKYHDGVFFCATHQSAWIVSQLRRDARVGFEIATNLPPYKGIRGTGRVELQPLGEGLLLQELIEQYLGNSNPELSSWLLSRQHEELIIKLKPIQVSHWDYSERMNGGEAAHG